MIVIVFIVSIVGTIQSNQARVAADDQLRNIADKMQSQVDQLRLDVDALKGKIK